MTGHLACGSPFLHSPLTSPHRGDCWGPAKDVRNERQSPCPQPGKPVPWTDWHLPGQAGGQSRGRPRAERHPLGMAPLVLKTNGSNYRFHKFFLSQKGNLRICTYLRYKKMMDFAGNLDIFDSRAAVGNQGSPKLRGRTLGASAAGDYRLEVGSVQAVQGV